MIRMMLLLVLSTAAAAAAAPANSPLATTEASHRVAVELTVYAQDLALVREIRTVTLPAGESRLEFRDVSARLDPATVRVRGSAEFALLEQDYETDLMSPDRILERWVGREVVWIQEDGGVVAGTILAVNNGPVYRVEDRIVFAVPGRLALPEMPAGLRERPALVWTVRTDRAGAVDLDASYLTGGLSWTADYAFTVDDAGRRGELQGWVSLDNRSGATFTEATLRLVAGDIRRAGIRPMPKAMMEMAARADDGFQEQAAHDEHIYTLGRPVTLRDRQTKQLTLLERDGVPVARHYRLRAAQTSPRADGTLPIEVAYRFANDEGSGLGLPLPAGVVRIYGLVEGRLQLLGEDRIGHTPAGVEIDLVAGDAFDLVAERTLVESRRLGERGQRSVVRITLRNRKSVDVEIAVEETVGGDWRVTASTLPPRRIDARTLAFDAAVPAGGETILEYTVETER